MQEAGPPLVGIGRGSVPPIGLGPAVEEGVRPEGEGGTSFLSITESSTGSTYHTTVPWRGGAEEERPLSGEAGPYQRKPISLAARGLGAEPRLQTQTLGPRRSLESRCPLAFRCEGRGASYPSGYPHFRGPDPSC